MVPKTIAGQVCTSLMLVFAVALLAFPLAISNSNFGALLKEQEKGKAERQEKRRRKREGKNQGVAGAGGDALVKLVWNPFGAANRISLSIARSALAIVLATRDVEGRLKEVGWMRDEEGTWSTRGAGSEDVVDALRTLVVGQTAS
jgi:hypothetical protein